MSFEVYMKSRLRLRVWILEAIVCVKAVASSYTYIYVRPNAVNETYGLSLLIDNTDML